MTRRKRILFAAFIACGVVIFIVCVSRADFSPVPKARITRVDSSTVAQVLCQNEPEIDSPAELGAPGPNSPFRKAVEQALAQNLQAVTAEYEIRLGFGAKAYCKDTIFLDTRQPDQIILSVKCERKDDTSDWSSSLFEFVVRHLKSSYQRDHDRENLLMVNTTEELKADHQARIEWLGKWRASAPDSL